MAPGPALDEMPGPFDHLVPEHIDKFGHFALFFLEARFLFLAFRHLPLSGRGPVGWTVATAGAMAVATEVSQSWLPSRVGDPWDVAADLGGIALWWLWQTGLLRWTIGSGRQARHPSADWNNE